MEVADKQHGPYGNCLRECCEREFGALPPLPPGYSVWWHAEHEHYQAHGPDEWESVITVNAYHARRWALQRAEIDERAASLGVAPL